MKKIRKAVVPVAGYGTRFLPISKTIPKEMLPIVDKPLIHHIVLELVEAGIEQIILVTNSYKKSVEDYFDRHLELEMKLQESGKEKELKELQQISELAEFVYVRQKEQRGNGDAILPAKNIIGDEPFLVFWGDDFIKAEPSRAKQLIEAYEKYQSVILGCIKTNKEEDTKKYGFIAGPKIADGVIEVENLVEKPGPGNAPSNLAVVSGFVFIPEIFNALESVETEPGQELVWVDGVNVLKNQGHKIYATEIKNGKYYDCGNVTEYLKTNIELSLKHPQIGPQIKDFLQTL
jgi:UTP--glucose-1-phosphate uridylyltransferase